MNLSKIAATVALAAAVVAAVPTAAVAHDEPSSSAGLQAGSVAVGLVGPRISWFEAFEHTNG
ncbi:hypothetical protein [Kitasatospora sp. CB02891]|uniref:hypothetical protein n=1 Tax=Kitasatospora sp. CB02891 TaxID=2020329 RepID=UPI000C279D4D|nr:hypothetical protein [Kitasatospora sp. CB02891]PJN21463.1 hypothetical protein CG736_33525 [Kitasatospora sp. CB02891]